MAQKVNPIALRLKINRDPESSWFSDYHYAKLFLQETHLRDYLYSIRQASGNKFGIRLAKCSIHHYPKKSLIHLFCLENNINNKFLGKSQENVGSKTKGGTSELRSTATRAVKSKMTKSVYSYHNTLKLPFLDSNKKQNHSNTWSKQFNAWFYLLSNQPLLVDNSLVQQNISWLNKEAKPKQPQQDLLLYEKVYKELLEKHVLSIGYLVFPSELTCSKQTTNNQQQVTLIAVLPKITRILLEHLKIYFETETSFKITQSEKSGAFVVGTPSSPLNTKPFSKHQLLERSSNSEKPQQPSNQAAKLENTYLGLHNKSKQFVLFNSFLKQANELIVKMGLFKIHFSVSNKAKTLLRFLDQPSLKHNFQTENFLQETYFIGAEEKYWLLANMNHKASFQKLVKTTFKNKPVFFKQGSKSEATNHLFYCCDWTQIFKNEVIRACNTNKKSEFFSEKKRTKQLLETKHQIGFDDSVVQHSPKSFFFSHLNKKSQNHVFEESRCMAYMNYAAMLYWLHFKTSLTLKQQLFVYGAVVNNKEEKQKMVFSSLEHKNQYDIVNEHLKNLTINTLSPALTETRHSRMSHIQTMLSNQTNTVTAIVPIQVSSIYQSASLIAQDICCKLQQKKAFRQICKILFQQISLSKFVKGIRISCSGRINGAEIAKTECKKFGETSLHVFSDQIDYAFCQALTAYGTLGVKVWVSYI